MEAHLRAPRVFEFRTTHAGMTHTGGFCAVVAMLACGIVPKHQSYLRRLDRGVWRAHVVAASPKPETARHAARARRPSKRTNGRWRVRPARLRAGACAGGPRPPGAPSRRDAQACVRSMRGGGEGAFDPLVFGSIATFVGWCGSKGPRASGRAHNLRVPQPGSRCPGVSCC